MEPNLKDSNLSGHLIVCGLPGEDRSARPAMSTNGTEFTMFVKRRGAGAYQVATADRGIRDGDDIIGAMWVSFKNEPGVP